jgi:hypothetical protein
MDETEWCGEFAGGHHVFAWPKDEVVGQAYHVGAGPDGLVGGPRQGEGLVDGVNQDRDGDRFDPGRRVFVASPIAGLAGEANVPFAVRG